MFCLATNFHASISYCQSLVGMELFYHTVKLAFNSQGRVTIRLILLGVLPSIIFQQVGGETAASISYIVVNISTLEQCYDYLL